MKIGRQKVYEKRIYLGSDMYPTHHVSLLRIPILNALGDQYYIDQHVKEWNQTEWKVNRYGKLINKPVPERWYTLEQIEQMRRENKFASE